ncbi:HEPN domain-containing protein [Rhodococcus qingshengii]|uniref:HEPN domain-containing protein n=1 Tax=Rhodococcus qingshengii TaxID=334542 RepID=UPI001ABFDECA|nr:HEPN domain-containing protein [Rhodococcus qingshengii]
METVLNKWVALSEQLGLPLDVLLGLDYITDGYYENRIFNVASAGEGIHGSLYPDSKALTPEQHAAIKATVAAAFEGDDLAWVREQIHWNRIGLKQRYLELAAYIDPQAATALLTDIETWARWLKNARNSIGHLETDGLDRRVPAAARFHLTNITKAFLHLVLLQELGLSPELQRKAVTDVFWHQADVFRKAVLEDLANRTQKNVPRVPATGRHQRRTL